jgi:protein gp37
MTAIEWTDKTWNPIVGCSVVSPGCTNCYAMNMAARLERIGVAHYDGTTQPSKAGPVWTGKLALAPEHILLEPLRRKKPAMWFVNSMGDLFHEDVPFEWIDRVFAVMALAPQHTFQVLTKRSARMRDYFVHSGKKDQAGEVAEDVRVAMTVLAATPSRREMAPALKSIPLGKYCQRVAWPLPNVWLGVSAEDQRRADERIPDLLATPAAVRFVSAEPLLGPIDFTTEHLRDLCGGRYPFPMLKREWRTTRMDLIDWVIVGGESGPGARPMHADWARAIRDQCVAAEVPFFFKQWGEWAPTGLSPQLVPIGSGEVIALKPDGTQAAGPQYIGGTSMKRGGKGRSGRLLDGRTWDEMPATRCLPEMETV